jgi:hypothetical protein
MIPGGRGIAEPADQEPDLLSKPLLHPSLLEDECPAGLFRFLPLMFFGGHRSPVEGHSTVTIRSRCQFGQGIR